MAMKRRNGAIVGPEVGDQSKLRPVKAARSLDEFIAFLVQIEALFGRIERPRDRTEGEDFRL
jgi:hypothetical protein